jgi:hypothetical protein
MLSLIFFLVVPGISDDVQAVWLFLLLGVQIQSLASGKPASQPLRATATTVSLLPGDDVLLSPPDGCLEREVYG